MLSMPQANGSAAGAPYPAAASNVLPAYGSPSGAFAPTAVASPPTGAMFTGTMASGTTFLGVDAFGNQVATTTADPYSTTAFMQSFLGPTTSPGYIGISAPLLGSPTADDIRTVFISGFPSDVKERELHNMLRLLPGFEACQMNWKAGAPQGFALFATPAHARQLVDALTGLQYDENTVLRAEMAHKNMFLKDDPSVKRGPHPTMGLPSGLLGATSPMAAAAAASGLSPGGAAGFMGVMPASPAQMMYGGPPLRPTSFSPVTNHRDNPPCNTLFIGNLGDSVSEVELRTLLSTQPGYKQLKVVRSPKATTAFVEFVDVPTAMMVHEALQGAVLGSSDRGGIRIQYSKNPYGRREVGMPGAMAQSVRTDHASAGSDSAASSVAGKELAATLANTNLLGI